jgi:hypothetical protein
MAMRATGGILLVISFVLFVYNVYATAIRRVPDVQPETTSVVQPSAPQAATPAAVR